MKKKSLTEKAYRAIKARIINMDLHPGVALSEAKIASELRMTRTPVREAIQRLKHEGFLKVVPYKGTFVNSVSPEEIRQIYETAEALEGTATRLAAEKASDRDVERLEKIIDRMKNALTDNNMESWVAADLKFHETVLEIAHNKYIIGAMKRINDQVHRARQIYIRVQGKPAQSTEDHEKVMHAIRAHDAKLAREITEQHLRRIGEDHIRIFAGLGGI